MLIALVLIHVELLADWAKVGYCSLEKLTDEEAVEVGH
jgi:hypothetical protein